MDDPSAGGASPEDVDEAPSPPDESTGLSGGTVAADGQATPAQSLRPSLWRPRLSRRRWVGVAAGATLVVALLVAGSRFIGSGATGPGASPGLPTGAGSIGASSTVQRSDGSASSTIPSGSATASSSQLTPPSAVPSQTAQTATITFRNLVVDSAIDPNRTTRTFTFTSDGPGTISAQVVTSSPMDATTICLFMDDAPAACATGGTPGFPSAVTETDRTRWTVTLISANESSPTVDVAFSWPTNNPSITLTHGRFQGAPNRDSLRTLTANFKPRANGVTTLDASWLPGMSDATVTLADVSEADATTVSEVKYTHQSATLPVYSAPVGSGRTYRLTLLNSGTDGLRPDLSATITFP